MSEEVQEEIEVQGPGAILKARRESLQLSIEEIAEKLHLRPAVVAELEGDIIDHSVSMTFTKGYVRLYAKHLEMDPTPVLAAFDELANPIKQPAKLQSFSQRVAKQASDTRLMILSYSILFVIIAMAVIWWFQQPEESEGTSVTLQVSAGEDAQPVPGEPELMAVSESLPAMPEEATTGTQNSGIDLETQQLNEPASTTDEVTDNVVNSREEENAAGTDASLVESSSSDSALLSQNATETIATTAPQDPVLSEIEDAANNNDVARELTQQLQNGGTASEQDRLQAETVQQTIFDGASRDAVEEDGVDATVDVTNTIELSENFTGAEPMTQELVFTFEQDCWMNLTDATGENIAYGVKNAGRVMPVSGIPPFEVVLGAPQGVTITVDGTPFDMSAFPAGRTARFVIGDLSESGELPE